MDLKWNWTYFCGSNLTEFWNKNEADFYPCFESYGLMCSSYVLFAVISAFYIGFRKRTVKRTKFQHFIIRLRMFITFLLFLCFLIEGALKLFKENFSDIAPVEKLKYGIILFSYIIHMIFLITLINGISLQCRGPKAVIFISILNFITLFIYIRSVILIRNSFLNDKIIPYIIAILLTLYLSSLIPKGVGEVIKVQNRLLTVNVDEDERMSLLQSGSYYESYTQIDSPVWSDLGVALAGSNILSRLTFHWINPLMLKGDKKLILTVDALFELPHSIRTSFIDTKFWILYKDLQLRATSEFYSGSSEQLPKLDKVKVSLLRALFSCFGAEYFLLGILKFLSDSLSFSGPLLLNQLLLCLENKSPLIWNKYYYSLGLFWATFLNAILSSQFQFLVNNLTLKIRAAIITTIFRKSLNVSVSSMSRINVGEIVNYMSTDTDRIQNFCPSFHQLWSLPLQITVCLILLYREVGIAFLAGIGFVLVLIPINHWLAKKIATLSVIMMDQKDKRVKLMNEILNGIQMIKFYAWEDNFSDWIFKYRSKEVEALKGRKYLDAACVYFWATTPILVSLLTFITFIMLGNTLTAAKIFTCIALVNILIVPLNAFPWVLNGLIEAWVSLKRVQNLLWLPEINHLQYYSESQDKNNNFQIINGDFSWKEKIVDPRANVSSSEGLDSSDFTLKSINVEIFPGQLIGVIGDVGSGKTTFLNAILAELIKIQGEVVFSEFTDGIGYVSQEAWIQQGTIRKNILFGKAYNNSWYRDVTEACALSEDISMFPSFDETEIGERGITLSGGQKARISLARAVYQDKKFYCLDDPLSAVDAEVATHIFDHCICGLLKKKTRILCTHQIKYLKHADLILVIKKGRIIEQGSPKDILSSLLASNFEIKRNHEDDSSVNEFEDEDILGNCSNVWNLKLTDKLIEDETKEEGPLKLDIHKGYWFAVGSCLASTFILIMFLMQGTRNATDCWLAYWISNQHNTSSNTSNLSITNLIVNPTHIPEYAIHHYVSESLLNSYIFDDDTKRNLIIYGSLVGANSILTLIRAFLFTYGGIIAAIRLHKLMMRSLMKGQMIFFIRNPLGRILNRFSSDLYAVDDSLPFMLNIFVAQSFGLLGSLIVMWYSLPWLVVIIIPLVTLYISIQNYYRNTSRELKRLSAISLSPIYAHFSETLTGLPIIRSFRAEAMFLKENEERLERSQRAQFALLSAGQWLNFRLQMIGVIMVTSIAFLALLEPTDASLIGLALSYALSVTSLLNGVVWSFTETEKEMVSTERVLNYINEIESEKWDGILEPPSNWPNQGKVQFKNVYMRYKEHHPYALQNLTFTIQAGEKIGIVGRTGAGKSSLFQVLFRLAELNEGEILIDGINIYLLDLKKLRSSLAIIPQDPVLFSTTIRNNLDPYLKCTDYELYEVLTQCHMKDAIEELGGLDVEIHEKGSNFSIGQKQLLCLARVLLSKAKIICIDEATANVDHRTDGLIQETIRESFNLHTVLTIAHRIETVLNSDRIIVMVEGKIGEFDIPKNLLADENSLFYKMVNVDLYYEKKH